jgi:hypothetical protein
VSDPAAPIVELTISARVKPSDPEAVKQKLLDRATMLVSFGASERLTAQASGRLRGSAPQASKSPPRGPRPIWLKRVRWEGSR